MMLRLLIILWLLPAVQTDNGKIVFSSADDIFVMNEDGSNRVQLTTHPEMDFDPVWSPDGSQIAFRSHRDGNEEIYIMNADGSNQHNLTNHPEGDWSPAWSPDGTQIAFASGRDTDSGNDIFLINVDGSNLIQLTDIPGISEYPTWSPDGEKIAFHCTFGRVEVGQADFEICVVNADGTDLQQITDTAGSNKQPAWSPDGEKIAFTSDRDGWPTLPDYTPPGYDEKEFGDKEIYIMNADGSNPTNLTNYPREDDDFAAWSRDGRIIFTRYGCLIVINVDGSDEQQLTPTRLCEDGFPDWD